MSTTKFTVDEIREGCADLWSNVECLTCSRLLGYIKDLLPGDSASVAAPAPKGWVDNLVGAFDDSPINAEVIENERRARQAIDEGRCPTCGASPVAAPVDAGKPALWDDLLIWVELTATRDHYAKHVGSERPVGPRECTENSCIEIRELLIRAAALPSLDDSIRAAAAEIARWMNMKLELPQFVVDQNALTIAAILSKHLVG